jgi:hypothetical protein
MLVKREQQKLRDTGLSLGSHLPASPKQRKEGVSACLADLRESGSVGSTDDKRRYI